MKQEPTLTFEGLSGREKAAILMVALGKKGAAEVFRQMNPREVEEVTLEIAELGNVPNELMERVLAEFYENTVGKRRVQQGGWDYARGLLAATYGQDAGEAMLGRSSTRSTRAASGSSSTSTRAS